MRSLLIWLFLGAALCLAPNALADRYFAAEGGGVELWLEGDDAEHYLQTRLIDSQGRVEVLMQPLELRVDGEGWLQGEGWAQGSPQSVRIRPSSDGAIEWDAPARLSNAAGLSVTLSGTYTEVAAADRLATAKAHFADADRALNAAYRSLRESIAAEDFAEIRANQRRWLKFRDWFVADGDDAGINGPGTVPFIRLQTARTLDRVSFLQGLGKPRAQPELSGRYSDGMDREIRLRAIPTVDKHAFIALISELPGLHQGGIGEPISISGRASPDEQARSWTASDGVSGNPIVAEDAELLIEPALDFESLWLSSAASELFTDRLWFVAELQPATEPMRQILLMLPAQAFDHTTEGLSEKGKTPLLLAGYYEPFSLSESGLDFARLSYTEGQVDIRRFVMPKGDALIAVATRNVRALQFELWHLARGAEYAVRVPVRDFLPSMRAADFYEEPGAAGDGVIEYRLSAELEEIEVTWRSGMDQASADYQFQLYWDHAGFGRYRLGSAN